MEEMGCFRLFLLNCGSHFDMENWHLYFLDILIYNYLK